MGKAQFTIEAEGFDALNAALRDVPRELRTDVNGELREAASAVVSRTLIPALRRSASTYPPQAKITATNIVPRRDRWPAAEVRNAAGQFRPRRSPGDANRFGAIYWGSIKGGGPKFGGREGDFWIGPAVKAAGPAAVREHEAAIAQLLARKGLL